MVTPREDLIEQFIEIRDMVGAEISLRHRAIALASEQGEDELADYLEGLTDSEYYNFLLEARRHERETDL